MVLTSRELCSVSVPASSLSLSPHALLDTLSGDKLVGLLRQIGQLCDFAAEMFSGLHAEAVLSCGRLSSLSGRVAALHELSPELVSLFERHPASVFYSQSSAPSFQRPADSQQSLFTADAALPPAIARLRAAAAPPPNLSVLDSITGRRCLQSYSDPQLFFDRWLKGEEEKMARAMDDVRQRKERRKKKKREERQQPRQVAAVTVKTYSAQGKEFESSMTPVQRQQQQSRADQQQQQQQQDDADEDAAGLSLASFRPAPAAPVAVQPASPASAQSQQAETRRQQSLDLSSAAPARLAPVVEAADSSSSPTFHEEEPAASLSQPAAEPQPQPQPQPPLVVSAPPPPPPQHNRQPSLSASSATPPPPPPRAAAAPPPPPSSAQQPAAAHSRQPSLPPPVPVVGFTPAPPPLQVSAPAAVSPPSTPLRAAAAGIPPPPPPRPASPMMAVAPPAASQPPQQQRRAEQPPPPPAPAHGCSRSAALNAASGPSHARSAGRSSHGATAAR